MKKSVRPVSGAPDRDGVFHEFPNGVRGQETVGLDLQFGGLECPAGEDMTRQEYGLSSDLAYQVQRFGVGAFPVKYGEQDFSLLDLTTAMQVVQESSQAWLRLPRVIRERYGSWQRVEEAAASGELEALLKSQGVEGFSLPSAAGDSGGSGGTTPGATSPS